MIDLESKIEITFIKFRLQRMLKFHGANYQFCAKPKLGCQDARFFLKSFAQDIRDEDQDTWVVFIDLVNSHDSMKHKSIEEKLKIFRAPDDLVSWVMKTHTNFEAEVNVGTFKSRFPCGCGYREGDNLAPMLFILVVGLAAEALDIELKKHNIQLPSVRVSTNENSVIRKHKKSDITSVDLFSH